MEHQDAEISDILVVLKVECAEKMDATVDALKKLGMEVENTDAANGVIEGTLLADKLAHVRQWECVQYVRVDFTYIADYPPGAPRNLDPADAGAEESED